MNLNNIKLILKDELILNLNFNKCIHFKNNKDLLNKINLKYGYFKFKEIFYLLKHKDELEKLNIFCPICGKKNKFIDSSKGYHKHCSAKCSSSDPNVIKTSKNTRKIRYNNENYVNSKQIKITKYIRYNNENYNNFEKAVETSRNNIDENGLDSYQRRTIIAMQTNAKNHNGVFNWSSNNPKWNGRAKRKQLYGVESCFASNNPDLNGETTMLKLYNVKNAFASKDPEINGKASIKRRYNVDNYAQTQEYRDLYNDKEWVERKNKKYYETLIKNNTYKKASKPEDKVYNMLIEKFGSNNIYRPFRNNLYPFKCDFYIKSLDLYIECHFSQFHRGKPFDINNKYDLIQLLCLQLKSLKLRKCKNKKNQYDFMIYTWTNLDVRKLETFKKNNLNYKIFYTEKEFNDWFTSL